MHQMESDMLSNVMNKFPVIPVVDLENPKENGLCEGFHFVLSTDFFPVVVMDKSLGIHDYRKFWRLMGYQVTEMEEKTREQWKKESFDYSYLLKDANFYEEKFSEFPENTLSLIRNKNKIDSEEELKELEDELNKKFKKFIIPYKMFSNILFYRPKNINVIKKGKIEFIVKKEDEDKVREFYEENRVNYSTSKVNLSDLNPYTI
jgi:hypothetical protein